MLKQIVKMKTLIQILAIVLTYSIAFGSLHAQMTRSRRFATPGGSSFRQNDALSEDVDGVLREGRMELETGGAFPRGYASSLMYQVHVLGEVNNPGTYRVMASERVAEVLQRAGGIAEQGSNRRIVIRRDGRTVKRVDLLKFQQYGKLEHNPYLLDNDVVYVPLKNRTIQVVGAVKRPETYELGGEKTAWEAVRLAGGFSSGVAKNEPVRIIRYVGGQKEVIEVSAEKSELINTHIEDGDVIFVPNVITAGHEFDYDIGKLPGDNIFYPSYEDRVFVLGGIAAPGAYPFNPYYNIHQYISLAGGYTKLSTRKMQILTPKGEKYKIKRKTKGEPKRRINPGDTILVGERRIPPEGWVNLIMGIAGFGLSTTATVLTLTR